MNKKLLFSFLAFLGVVSVKAQRNELGVRLGMSNLVGDVGRTNYILQKPLDLNRMSDWGIPFMVDCYIDLILTRIRPLDWI
jgi:hypothetical protein